MHLEKRTYIRSRRWVCTFFRSIFEKMHLEKMTYIRSRGRPGGCPGDGRGRPGSGQLGDGRGAARGAADTKSLRRLPRPTSILTLPDPKK